MPIYNTGAHTDQVWAEECLKYVSCECERCWKNDGGALDESKGS